MNLQNKSRIKAPTLHNKFLFFMLLLAVITITPFFLTLYYEQKAALIDGIDEKLRTAALMARATLPADYHDKLLDSNSVTDAEYQRIVDKNNKLCTELGLEYIWSLQKINGKIVFTSSTSPDKNVKNRKHAAFFEKHSNPNAYKEIFTTMKASYQIITDKWGRIRVVLVPFRDTFGRSYIFGACMRLTDVDKKLHHALLTCVLISLGILFGAICVSIIQARFMLSPIKQLTDTIKGLSDGNSKLVAEERGSYEQIVLAGSFNKLNKTLQDKIAEYNKSEKLLEESEDRHCAMIANISDVIKIIDANCIIQYISPNITKWFGWYPNDLLYTDGWLTVHLEDVERIKKEFFSLLEEENSSKTVVYKYKCKDGSYKPIELTAVNLINDSIINGVLLNYRDITKRRIVEEALCENEQRQREMIKNLPGFIYRCKNDEDWTMEFISDGCKNITGYSAEDFMFNKKLSFNDIVRSDYSERLWNKVQDHLLRKEPFQHNSYPIITASGQTRWMWERGYGVFSDDGQLLYLEGFITDITEKKKVEENLKKLSRAVEQSQVSIVITNKDAIVEYVNPKFLEVTGYLNSEIVGSNPRILKSGEFEGNDYKEMWDILTSGKEWKGIFHNKKKNGEFFWESATISPVKNDQSEITHYVAVKEDISEKKEMEQNLHIALERAEEISRLKSNFLANMNHELRTPLNGILGFAGLLSEELKEKEHVLMATAILNSGKRLNETLNLILDLSNIEAERMDIPSKQLEVVAIIKNVAKLFAGSAIQKNLQYNINTKEENIYSKLDEHFFPRVIHNLIDNAIKYTEKGSVTVEIGIEPQSDNKKFYVKIIDTGIGIPDDKINVIWDAFRQGSEGLSRCYEGTGLGLTISKKIIQLLHGEIEVESEVGKGTVFTIKFPIIAATIENTKQKIEQELKPTTLPAGDKILIKSPSLLYVEDDEINQNVVKLFLKNKYLVDKAIDAKTALEKVKQNKYDIILMDINLGQGMNGAQVTKEIRKIEDYKITPIIAITAYTTEADKLEFFKAGCSHYLAKPFLRDDLLKLLESIV